VNGEALYRRIGSTSGWGHFHLSNGTFELIREFLAQNQHPVETANRFGQGPNWKIRAVRTCLEMIGLSPELLRHGIKRDVYVVETARNAKAYLRRETNKPDYRSLKTDELTEFFESRWLLPRAARLP